MQWFSIPNKIYFEAGSINYLEKMPDMTKTYLITDESMVKLGYVDKLLYYIRKRNNYVNVEIFSKVNEPEKDSLLSKCLENVNAFNPDVIIALGGGSVVEFTKNIWLFYECPDVDVKSMDVNFVEARSQVYNYKNLGNKCKMIAIPTTSGTGNEFTGKSCAVLDGVKYDILNYDIVPDVVIMDPEFTRTIPKNIVAEDGLEVLCNLIEAYVSTLSSDYSDALVEKAFELVFEFLPKSYIQEDMAAREKIHNASALLGMAYANTALGLAHAIANVVSEGLDIPYAKILAICTPHIIKFNSVSNENLDKIQKYAILAKKLGLPTSTLKEGISSLIKAEQAINDVLGQERRLKLLKIDEQEYTAKIDEFANEIIESQDILVNPRKVELDDIKQILKEIY